MSEDVMLAGRCYGLFDKSDAACSICLVRKKCITMSGVDENFVGNIRRENKEEPISTDPVDSVPVDVMLCKISESIGTPSIERVSVSGGDMVLYRFYNDDENEVVRVGVGVEGNVFVMVAGMEMEEFSKDASCDDFLIKAELVLKNLIV